jgi:hypothetical protein
MMFSGGAQVKLQIPDTLAKATFQWQRLGIFLAFLGRGTGIFEILSNLAQNSQKSAVLGTGNVRET